MKRSWIKRSRKPMKRSRLRRVSKKRMKADEQYSILRKLHLHDHPTCQARWICKGSVSIEIHHKAGRSGSNYLDRDTWLAICRECHTHIHQNPNEARKRGLLK